ncbi:hypothetical protein Micbo1qcDRAFT_207739 [Microdochium bolleyi]|uniref:MobA-like NTP transferase domain-containing protein n=1 Tax=Microdochium bolleyi TaxID=196109 RepID=A0A136IT82_9PEZI|nr:hypothetical protein Micbo1qcDRAFT_207739 [Microdochium bolleyi]
MASPPPPPPPSTLVASSAATASPIPTAALILAGGPSSRMGYPKHLLKLPNGRALYLALADTVHRACPHLPRIYISLAEGSYLDEDLRATLSAYPGQHARPPVTTVNADNTRADAAVVGLDPPNTHRDEDDTTLPPLELSVIWDKKTPILYPPPTRAQQRREEKKRSRERPERKSSYNHRSTSSSTRRTMARMSDGSTTAPATPHGNDSGETPVTPAAQHGIEADGDIDALGGISGSATAGEGPIRGFLAAHEALPDATWLIIACDYPRLTVNAIRYLIDAYESPVTCFQGARAKMEPLVSIWSPEALAQLKRNCDPASTGVAGPQATGSPVTASAIGIKTMDLAGGEQAAANPTTTAMATGESMLTSATTNTTLGILGTIRQLHGKLVEVPPGGVDDIWMYNVNTPGNWDTAVELYDL